MKVVSKFFDELSTKELYEIIKARMEIFVVEQNCNYQDLDDVDFCALHIFIMNESNQVQAYMRAFYTDEERKTVRIGRVLTREHGRGTGKVLLSEGLEIIKEKMQPERIYVESQCHAIGFYEREGFKICSEEFLDVGIPHKGMELFV